MESNLTDDKKKLLLRLARVSIIEEFDSSFSDERQKLFEECKRFFKQKQGVFVTLTIGGSLRGCIGYP